VYYDSIRRAIWHFQLLGKENQLGSQARSNGLGNAIEVSGFSLSITDEGSFEPISLFRSRFQGLHSISTPTSSSSSNSAQDSVLRTASAVSAGHPAGVNPLDADTKIVSASGMDVKASGTISSKDTYEFFVSALLSSISCAFCRNFGAIPLSYRTVLLSPTRRTTDCETFVADDPAMTATFRIYLTTTGSLIIGLSLSRCESLRPLSELQGVHLPFPGSQLLAAPLGVLARVPSLGEGHLAPLDSAFAQTPDTQMWRARADGDAGSSQWRQTCTKLLQLRGIPASILSRCPWINIQIPRRKLADHRLEGKRTPVANASTTIAWPSSLCFSKRPANVAPTNLLGDTMIVSQDIAHDPLNGAKSWFLADPERADKSLRRKKERESAAAQELADAESRLQQTNDHSPLTLRRASNTAAAGAMYPTPPDAVQNQTGVTPSLDGTVSSPGNQAATVAVAVAVVNIETTMTNSNAVPDSYGDSWDSGDGKRDRGDEAFLGQAENLFGDMGADMFGDTDITDADFNFFDEQLDEHPRDDGLDLGTLPEAAAPEPAAQDLAVLVPGSNNPQELGIKVEADLATFTKPELRHARSSLVDERQTRADVETVVGVKRQPSPFDPDTVFKRVRASLFQNSPATNGYPRRPTRKGSIFDKVDFDPILPEVNSKYEVGGRFDCNWKSHKENSQIGPSMPPTTDYLQRHNRHKKTLKDLPSNTMSLIARITGSLENSTIHASPANIDDLPSDTDDISLVSDQDDSTATSDEPSSPVKLSVKRIKLDDDALSQVTSLKEGESTDESDPNLALELPRIRFDVPELAVTKYFADPEPVAHRLSVPDEDLMTVAQILTEQAVSGSLNIKAPWSNMSAPPAEMRRDLFTSTRRSLHCLRDVVPASLGEVSICNFRTLIEVQDVPLLGQPSRLQPRPAPPRDPNSDPFKPPNIFQIQAPHLELRRSESKLSVLPAAVSFWESLGLGPSQGSKDIASICVFPNWDGLSDTVTDFLNRMSSVYESIRLGSFERLQLSPKRTDGLLPYDVEKISTSPNTITSSLSSALAETVDILSYVLSNSSVTEKNFVVFFVYSPGQSGSIVEACAAFQQLFERFKRALAEKKKTPSNELVLQLVALDYVSSSTSVIVPSHGDLINLALETYDRCRIFGGAMPCPAIVLEQPTPRVIDFKLLTSSSASLMHENSCIHIAYAQSVDERWVTAAWTDNRGSQQMTASYCLGRKGKPLTTSMADVAYEIWETTHDLISVWKVHWRIIVTKCGPMDQPEIDSWVNLAQTEAKATVSLTLVTANTDPSLQLIPPVLKPPQVVTAGFYTTPVSTPQASIVSPDQSGNPSTPVRDTNPVNATTPGGGDSAAAAESDGDSFLVDVTDQTWGAVLSHRLSNSASLSEPNPALISGYLVKRGGMRVEDPPVVMEVSVVHSDGNPRASYEPLLREILVYFRGLGTLARARRMVDRETDVRPWHVAAAEKGIRALYLLM
jgi:mediator of RNA polymerase II transcription subunit 13, fungi type